MTMTLADSALDDGGMGPRADRPKRRVFTAEYTAGVLAEYEEADRGERGAILRREGCIPPTSWSGARPPRPALVPVWRRPSRTDQIARSSSGTIIETGTDSYRLAHSRSARE
ncbi:hypothetical protein ASG78_02410 [Nostocoides sp. Soil756]|jgi:hypothetical protein|nr:hypothetical protein ASG78_02410 [Tetrasphaera sp. Soil756]